MSRIPQVEIPSSILERIESLGGKPLNLYRVLANNEGLLQAWIEFAYRLRGGKTPRALRELMILRTAQLNHSSYEWQQHLIMARATGVKDSQIEALASWRESVEFSAQEKTALALTEAIVHNEMTDAIFKKAAEQFSNEDMIELLLTASFYCMVPRFLNAIDITTDNEQ